jgi:hypothetical protein
MWEHYLKKVRRFIQELPGRINKLEYLINNSAKKLNQEYRPEMEELKNIKRQLISEFKEFKEPAIEAWTDMKNGLNKAAAKINSSVKKFFA